MAAESDDEQCWPCCWESSEPISHSLEATPEKSVITDADLYCSEEMIIKDGAEQFDLNAIYFQLLCTRLNSASSSGSVRSVRNMEQSSPKNR